MDEPRRNLEVKLRCPDPEQVRRRAEEIGASHAGTFVQTDTYFHARSGRLKLREVEGHPATLIAYARPDREEERISAYHLVPIPDPEPLRAGLAATLGVRVVVRKRRELYLWRNVRLHIDAVEGLGSFFELEAVLASPSEEAAAREDLPWLLEGLGLQREERLATSYSDLLLRTSRGSHRR